MRKRILHFIKTNHFKLRQKERSLNESEIKNAIIHGDMSERDGSVIFNYKNLEVVTNFEDDLLITIIKKPTPPKSPKIIDDEVAEKIKDEISKPKAVKAPKDQAPSPTKQLQPDELHVEDGEVEISLDDYLNQTKK